MRRTREPRNKNKHEFIVTFETKQIRDAVKAVAPNLANFRETAGMRLHIPDHLQRDFHALMNLSFDLKKKTSSSTTTTERNGRKSSQSRQPRPVREGRRVGRRAPTRKNFRTCWAAGMMRMNRMNVL